MVNHNYAEYSGKCIKLEADINLFGKTYTEYTGSTDLANITSALQWKPIGGNGRNYKGTFDGGGHEIDGLYINGSDYVGLFGAIEYPAKIRKLGIGANSKVISRGIHSALFAGAVQSTSAGGSEITDCYNFGTLTGGSSVGTFVGKDLGSNFSVTISNSYNAGYTTSFAHSDHGKIENCYADTEKHSNNAAHEKSSGNGVTSMTTAQMKTNELVTGLNTRVDTSGTETLRTGTDRVWYTSLDAETTKGYPTLKAPTVMTVEFAQDTPEAGSQVSLPGGLSVADMKLRSFESVDSHFTPGSAVDAADRFTQTAFTELAGAASKYHRYGYTEANQKLAFKAGNTDLLGLTGTLNNPVTALGTVDSVSLGRAAAYTKPEDRYLLLEGARGTSRYEIQMTVKGAASKMLSVIMPVEVTMAQLTPDGTDRVDFSANLSITNDNAYPIDGKILGVTPKSGSGYVELKPVARSVPLPNNREITDALGGVRLGLSNQAAGSGPLAADVYYDPGAASGTSWLEYRLKNGGTLPYRYFIEYGGLHFSGAVDQFGYDISYAFSVSEREYTVDDAVVIVAP